MIIINGDQLDPASNKGFIKLRYISVLASDEVLDFLDSLNLIVADGSVYS